MVRSQCFGSRETEWTPVNLNGRNLLTGREKATPAKLSHRRATFAVGCSSRKTIAKGNCAATSPYTMGFGLQSNAY